MEQEENIAFIKETLNCLPPDAKSILILRDIQGLSYKEISEITEMELGTVKSRINRARIAFKNLYLKKEDR